MCIPKPFARVIIHYGDPVAIHRDASDETLESVSAELRTAIIAAEKASFESLQVENDLDGDA